MAVASMPPGLPALPQRRADHTMGGIAPHGVARQRQRSASCDPHGWPGGFAPRSPPVDTAPQA
eukprot:10504597-Alexandrium_andersonii.AAC.1